MKQMIVALTCFVTVGFAHNSYTGGYSGAPGMSSCASSCHGGTGGTILVTGFPALYQPLQTYRIAVKHTGGSLIVNFNATTRVGATSAVAGTFATVSNSTLYGGADGGVYASPHSIDSAVFQWTAPSAGTGPVNFYVAGYQGTTSSSGGQSKKVTLAASESTTGATEETSQISSFVLMQNYPNPFNPLTRIEFRMPVASRTTLKVYDVNGKETATLISADLNAGIHTVDFDASNYTSGIYFYRLTTNSIVQTRKMIFTK